MGEVPTFEFEHSTVYKPNPEYDDYWQVFDEYGNIWTYKTLPEALVKVIELEG